MVHKPILMYDTESKFILWAALEPLSGQCQNMSCFFSTPELFLCTEPLDYLYCTICSRTPGILTMNLYEWDMPINGQPLTLIL